MIRLALVLLAASGAARASEPAPLSSARARFPGLFDPALVSSVAVTPGETGGQPGLLPGAVRFDADAKTLRVDPDALAALEGRFPAGTLRPGAAAESAVAHELLRALARALPGVAGVYSGEVAGGRFDEFRAEARKSAGHDALEMYGHRAEQNHLRLQIEGGMTRKQYLDGARGLRAAEMGYDFDEAEKLTLEAAKAFVDAERTQQAEADRAVAAALEPPLGAAGKSDGEIARALMERRRSDPGGFLAAQRKADDAGLTGERGRLRKQERDEIAAAAAKRRVATGLPWSPDYPETQEDFFARCGQLALYGPKPSAYLTAREARFWDKVALYLAREGKFPGPDD